EARQAEEARLAEEERQRVEEEARRRAEEEEIAQRLAEARRRAEEEERQRVEQDRLRAEEEERARQEQERLRAEEEAHRAEEMRFAEAARRAEEARLAEEARHAEAIRQRELEDQIKIREESLASETVEAEPETLVSQPEMELFEPTRHEDVSSIVTAPEPLIEHHREPSEWFDVDMTDVKEIEPVASASAITEIETFTAEASAPVEITETGIEERSETGIETVEEEEDFSAVPVSILRRLSSEDSSERASAVSDLARVGGEDAFRQINAAFDDPVQMVRDAAARSLYQLT